MTVRAYRRHLGRGGQMLCQDGTIGVLERLGYSWARFCAEGIPVALLMETGDGYARLVARRATAEVRAREAARGQE